MKRFAHLLLAGLFALQSYSQSTDKLILDMVHHNPGEAFTESVFNDPVVLSNYGFNGQVINEFKPPHCAVTYDEISKDIFPAGSEERKWADALAERINEQIEKIHAQGLKAYYFMDIILFPKRLVDVYKEELCSADGKIDWDKPRTKEFHRIMIKELFERFPYIDGLVVRTGENYRQNIPYHQGNELVNNSHKDEAIRKHAELVQMLREEVCVKRNKTVVYRTWDYAWNAERGFLHTQPDYYLGVTDSIEPHENLFFAIKHTAGDYFRTFPFNKTIGIGRHRQVIEVQCQREYEGKGAYANYIADAVVNGFEEYAKESGRPNCLNDFKHSPLYAGIWTWSRGGGWGGPYLKSEFWCEANAYVLSHWGNAPERSEKELFLQFARMKGFDKKSAGLLHQIALLSSKAVLRGRASNIITMTQHQLEWTRDDNMRGLNNLKELFDEVIRKKETGRVLAEKRESVKQWERMKKISARLVGNNADEVEAVRASVEYGRLFFTLTYYGWAIMLKGQEAELSGMKKEKGGELQKMCTAYERTKEKWKHFCATNSWAATIYKVEELDESVNKYR